MEHYKWPKIRQFRNVVRAVNDKTRYIGRDEDGNPVFDNSISLPTLEYVGTTKLHGTNASVVIDSNNKIWFQSRKNIITFEKDNAGFAAFASHSDKIKIWLQIADNVRESYFFVANRFDVVIFGEWCGQGIQKGVAISELPKMFVIFGIDIITHVDDGKFRTHLDRSNFQKAVYGKNYDVFDGVKDKIYSIEDFGFFRLQIDFENPENSQNKLIEITEGVEKRCPAGMFFGIRGVGEGVVWKCLTLGFESSDFWFKVKGEKHSKTKVKKLSSVDTERLEKINELAESLTTPRLEQISQDVFDLLNGGCFERENIGLFIKAMMKDIFDEEESDIISESGFSGKELAKSVGVICKNYVFSQERKKNVKNKS